MIHADGEGLQRFRVPLGSLVVDVGLVIALVWWGASMQTRFEESRAHDEELHAAMLSRLNAVEQRTTDPNGASRLTALETRMLQAEAARQELKQDMNARFDRLEDLIRGKRQ